MKETGLLSILAGVVGEPAGYLVLADWLEEHLDRGDLAGVLRRSLPGPPPPFAGPVEVSMRYQRLDARTMLCLVRYFPEEAETGGHLLCLGTLAGPPGEVIRWVRWLPATAKPDWAMFLLWDRASDQRP